MAAKEPVRLPKPAPMNMDDLRSILSDEITKIREGQTSAANVNAISNASGKILSSLKLQMEYFRLTGKPVSIPLLAEGTVPQE